MVGDDIIEYAWQHRGEDPVKMLLKGDLPDGLDAQKVADQLEGMAMAPTKWPWLAENRNIAYPRRLNREQSSSETAARYKASLVGEGETVADLTGGMGVDSMMFAYRARHVDYVERDSDLCDIMEHNARVLGLGNISCHCGDCVAWLKDCDRYFDWIYIDPARRDSLGRKLVRLADCQPDVLELLPLLRERCKRLLIKASPMIDIHDSVSRIGIVQEVHIVAVGHECKEVLFLADSGKHAASGGQRVVVKCVDTWNGGEWKNEFVWGEETPPRFAGTLQRYLYEPNSALMKGGPWGEICRWYGVEKLDRNTHLYTSERHVEEFPGRVFEMEQEMKLNRKAVRAVVERANVVVRNYPVDATTLRKQLGVADGGEKYIIATTLKGEKKGLLCRRVLANT
ncbi:MAG: SAM-dependent methyltransferase [Bacteroidales bacterium]|nr:SAM-dependent methyltransferase [Bacteroidales bacterium]